jgi:ubiquinone/menaquinone biosynthesis C-methylase UbiE
VMSENTFETKVWNSYAAAYDDLALYYKPYKQIISTIVDFIKVSVKNGTMLDAGCGTGELTAQLSAMGFCIDAVDISETMLNTLRKKIKTRDLKSVNIKLGDLNKKLDYKNNSFNVVINVHSLFMLKDKWFTLNEFNRVLKKSGYLILAHHKPMKVWKGMKKVAASEGLINGIITFFRLFRVVLFNLFMEKRHHEVYGHVSAGKIERFLGHKGIKLIFKKKLYNGFDDFMIFRKL